MREDLLERINHLLGDDGENDREFLLNVVSAGETSVAVEAIGSYKDLLRKEEP